MSSDKTNQANQLNKGIDMKVKHILIAALVLCLAVPPAFLGSLAAVVNAASQNTPPVAYDQSV
ncbi:MAG TPA: hypothetical protein PLH68_00330, partial [Anaerolineaceae bacterium]|nr:hypothetical protein [Anaerolineaceae bacterium]